MRGAAGVTLDPAQPPPVSDRPRPDHYHLVETDPRFLSAGAFQSSDDMLSQMLTSITGAQVQANKAVVGKNAFAHEAGIHQHGVMASPMTYEIMTPESVGAKTSRLVLGKHRGRHALDKQFKDLGFNLDLETLAELAHAPEPGQAAEPFEAFECPFPCVRGNWIYIFS